MERLLTILTLVTTIALELTLTAVPCAAAIAAVEPTTTPTPTRWKVSSYVMRSIQAQRNSDPHASSAALVNRHPRKHALHFGCFGAPGACDGAPGLSASTNASTCCNGFCKDVQFDSFNCGGCNRGCFFGASCCSSTCVDLLSDRLNCGRCGVTCSAGPCTFGLCNYG
ncbi:hypothetical protein MPTK1_1g26300 [Marchantia polymorpha subsp. ruderalis]|uniref:Uncharacterized protein n=2 Tax=Marchantia polymorpha TaxID=3197 RepID=A0AAF6AUG7_MARPO|nr:hypothetical protein MARPO_0002s0248 [Marchantia polymorpha]BBN00088.1 hypothetical protein Mp_1g26300 [Marchantia polymorpha subsp. ruderalis]|eukprot:PTQ49797.1 hypothetical protein MARPO_0002s0248 [Marchantia polymorpha]